jgi:adenosylcobinamide-phosphate synthase
MNLLAILAALGLEQWHAFRWRAGAERTFAGYIRRLEGKLNGGTIGQGVVATALAILPPVVGATLVWWIADRIHPVLGLVWNTVVLYLLMGFRRFSHAVSVIIEALRENDVATARRALSAWRGGLVGELGSDDIARLSIEQGLTDAYRQVFAVLFWFIVLPGPAGAVLYRAAVLLAHEWKGIAPGDDATPVTRSHTEFGKPARGLLSVLDCWRIQAKTWPETEGGEPIGTVLASGAGALGVQIGGPLHQLVGDPYYRPELGIGDPVQSDVLPSAVGLVWRALVLWLLLILLITLANWAP